MLDVFGPSIGCNFLNCTLSFFLLFSYLSFFEVRLTLFEVSEDCFSKVDTEITLYVATQLLALELILFFLCDSELRLLQRSTRMLLTLGTHPFYVISKSDDVVKLKVVLTAFHCRVLIK